MGLQGRATATAGWSGPCRQSPSMAREALCTKPSPPMLHLARECGDLFVVVSERIRVRESPDPESLVENIKERWSILELYHSDSTGQWRLCLEASHEFGHPGWVRLTHPEHGRLLRPLGPVQEAAHLRDTRALSSALRGL